MGRLAPSQREAIKNYSLLIRRFRSISHKLLRHNIGSGLKKLLPPKGLLELQS